MMHSLLDLQKKRELCKQIQIIIQKRKDMSSLDSYDDLISSILKDAIENEDGELEFETCELAELILGLMTTAFETTPKTMTLVVMHLSKNPHIIQELRVSMFPFKTIFL
jgi:cytochrome P450